ncbi:interleukin-1 family member A isoform X1 [Anguilla rostrata]|uniref:interleukin-1 family member A isoform X1 n=1 Tax=Anguilla rostrata TaxID=7938 RepID=UPI0030CA62BD
MKLDKGDVDYSAVNSDLTMDAKVNSVNGGVSILHKVVQGKHHYEVDRVVKIDHVAEPYLRNRDKLLKINGQDLENLSPETFAELLTKGSPMLTVHQSSQDTPQEKCEVQQGMYPFSKEETVMHLSLEMRQEEELEEEHEEKGGENDRRHPNGKKERPEEGNESHSSELDGILLVSMTNTSISIIEGRGCTAESPCHDCGGTECNFSDVVVVAQSTKLTLVSREIANFLQERVRDSILIRGLVHDMYINNRDKTAAMSSPPSSDAEISIYFYKSDSVGGEYPGCPVVLNFTRTDNFLKCNKQDDKAVLSIESCDKRKLKHIIRGDKETWPFVFYMKANRDNTRRFESANCRGWFIHSQNENVGVKCQESKDETFLFIIQKKLF